MSWLILLFGEDGPPVGSGGIVVGLFLGLAIALAKTAARAFVGRDAVTGAGVAGTKGFANDGFCSFVFHRLNLL